MDASFVEKTTEAISPFLWGGSLYEPETDLYWMRNRYYSKEMKRFINVDPLGIWGDANNLGNGFAYVADMVVEASDPTGLKTEVIFWRSALSFRNIKSTWSSAFGHLSVRIDDTSYSWGPEGMDIRPFQSYYNKQRGRSGIGVIIPLNKREEKNLKSYLTEYSANSKSTYNPLSNNCVAPVSRWLQNTKNINTDAILPSMSKTLLLHAFPTSKTVLHLIQRSKTTTKTHEPTHTTNKKVFYDVEAATKNLKKMIGDNSKSFKTTLTELKLGESTKVKSGSQIKAKIIKITILGVTIEIVVPFIDSVSEYPVPGDEEKDNQLQMRLRMNLLRNMLKLGTPEQEPFFIDRSTGPNGTILFYRNPYYRKKDSVKSIMVTGHDGSGRPVLTRNPLAAPDGNIWSNTYEKFQAAGFIQTEVDPWLQ